MGNDKLRIFRSPINPEATLDKDDLIVDVDQQIDYLVGKELKVTNVAELKHIIENYGFNNLFRKYSGPFIENSESSVKFIKCTDEQSILKLYYFDVSLKNLLINFLGLLETKLTGNIINEVNLKCPVVKKQLDYLWPSKKQQPELIKKLKKSQANGSDYLTAFIDANVYPGWVILDELTLGEKMTAFNKLINVDKILENFYLSHFKKHEFYSIFFDFVRPFRNVISHFDRLLKFIVKLTDGQKFLWQKFLKEIIVNSEYYEAVLLRNNSEINSFGLILIMTYLLGSASANHFVGELISFIEKYEIKEKEYFDLSKFLINQKFYNWPNEWKEILHHALTNKKAKGILFTEQQQEELLS